jgi:hypothetical protein
MGDDDRIARRETRQQRLAIAGVHQPTDIK